MEPKFYEPDTLRRLQQEILSILDDFLEICETWGLEYYGIAGTAIGAIRHKGFIPWDDDIDLAMPRRDFEKFCRIVEKNYGDRYRILNAERYPAYPLMTTRMVKKGTVFVEEAMKDVDCPFGIFLDLYVLDNIADGKLAYEKQAWTAWFFSKLMILRAIKRPVLAQKGLAAKVIWAACGLVNRGLRFFRVSPEYLYRRCSAECRRYNRKATRRMAFLGDSSPYWNTVDREHLYPLLYLPFEGRRLAFPAGIDAMLRLQYGDYMVMPPEEKRKTHYPRRLEFSAEGENS